MKKFFAIKDSERALTPVAKRGNGFLPTEKPFNQYFNDVLYRIDVDYILGTQTQVTNFNANVYYDGVFKDILGATVTFVQGDRIAIVGLDALAGDITFSVNDLVFMMNPDITIDLASTYKFLLTGSGVRGNLNFTNAFQDSIDLEASSFLDVITDFSGSIVPGVDVIENGNLSNNHNSIAKNFALNGGFRQWGSGVSFSNITTATIASNGFEAWGAGGGANFSPTTLGGVNDGFQFAATTDDVYLSYKIKSYNARTFDIDSGGTKPLTVSFRSSYSANIAADNCDVEIIYPSAIDDYSTSEQVDLQSVSITTVNGRHSVTFDIPDQSTSNYDYYNGIQVKLTLKYNTGAATILVDEFQAEKSSFATPFEWSDRQILDTQYSEAAGDFTVTGTSGWSFRHSYAVPYQTSDGTWRLRFNFRGVITSSTAVTLTVSGVTFSDLEAVAAWSSASTKQATTNSAASTITVASAAAMGTDVRVSGDVALSVKPTWAE